MTNATISLCDDIPMNFLVEQQPAFAFTGNSTFDAAKPSVIFIHGAANDHRVWLDFVEPIAKLDWNVLAIDLPGHGKTFAAAKSTIEDYADWLIDLLDNGAIKDAVLVGHSMGSLIALDCARRYASRVTKLVLIGSALPMAVSDVLMTAAREQPDDAFDMLTRWSHHVPRNVDGTFPPASATMIASRALLGESRYGVLAIDLNACAHYTASDATLANITPKTLVIAGRRDKLAPCTAAETIAANLPNANVVVFDNVGHAIMQDAPGETLAALTAFL
ncbi:MAG: alpha/beta hydrolase [Pseudomonadota bacterium]